MTPYEIIAVPLELWVAPVGTTFPLIDAAPGVGWTKLGTSGRMNYFEDGVTVSLPQTLEAWRSAGHTGPRKFFRTEEDLMISVKLADMTLENFSIAMNYNAVTDTPAGGEAGFRKIGLSRGFTVNERALLARGPSPYDEALYMQFQIWKAVSDGSPEMAFTKGGEPAGYEINFKAGIDPTKAEDEAFGILIACDAVAIS